MDIRMRDELVAMRQEELRRAARRVRPVTTGAPPRLGRRAAARATWERVAMWAFGPGAVAPRVGTRRSRRDRPATAETSASSPRTACA